MNISKHAAATAFSVVLAAGIVACSDEPPTVGQQIDRANAKMKKKADEVAQDARAVTRDAAEKATEVAQDVQAHAGDALITTKVKTALVQEPGLSALKINVDTANGIVTLRGTVDSVDKADLAREVARAVDGVAAVDNRLVVGNAG